MIVIPSVKYGAIAWVDKTFLSTAKASLSKVQRLACLCITGATSTAPTAALEKILQLPPLFLVVQEAAKLTLARMGTAIHRRSIAATRGFLLKDIVALDMPKDEIPREFNFAKNFKVILSNKREFNVNSLASNRQDIIKWYTDGSKIENGTGAGIHGPRAKISVPMGHYPTIFHAEVHAIGRCAQLNIDRMYKRRHIWIMSDSQAAIKALLSPEITSGLVKETLITLNELGRENIVTLIWIPGHTGIPGNEVADALAKDGAYKGMVGPEPFCGIGKNAITEEVRLATSQEWLSYWNNHVALRQAKTMLSGFTERKHRFCIQLNKGQLRAITNLLTGHGRLNKHLYRMGLKDSSLCRFCEEAEETSTHLLMNCPSLNGKRLATLGKYQLSENDISHVHPSNILSFLQKTGLFAILG